MDARYSEDGLTRQIAACRRVIQEIKTAKRAESTTIAQYDKHLRDLRSGASSSFTEAGLTHGIERCRVNMASLESASSREREAVKQLEKQVLDLREAERLSELEIVVELGDNQIVASPPGPPCTAERE